MVSTPSPFNLVGTILLVAYFYTADRLAEVDNKNYIQLRNNVLV